MTIRRRTKSSSRAARAKRPIPANNQSMVAPPKRARPPLIEQFHVAVDRQLKSGYGAYEAAEKAALVIKKRHPQLQVTVYDFQRAATYDHRTAKGWRRPTQKTLSSSEAHDLSTPRCCRRQALTDDPARKLHVPSEWEAAAAEIFERRLRTILVIGGSAVGKSSFCRYLAGALLTRQAEVAFVDADIGQSNLGPPAAVTLGYPTLPVDFSTVPPAAYYFVGSTGPIGRFLPLVIGTASLAREARGAFVIIDTTGLVHEFRPRPQKLQDRIRSAGRHCRHRKAKRACADPDGQSARAHRYRRAFAQGPRQGRLRKD